LSTSKSNLPKNPSIVEFLRIGRYTSREGPTKVKIGVGRKNDL
jgi:hypothetical protein